MPKTGAFINNFIHLLFSFYLNAVNPPTPESMLFEVKESLEGLKYNIGFRGREFWFTGGGDRHDHCSRKGLFMRSI